MRPNKTTRLLIYFYPLISLGLGYLIVITGLVNHEKFDGINSSFSGFHLAVLLISIGIMFGTHVIFYVVEIFRKK